MSVQARSRERHVLLSSPLEAHEQADHRRTPNTQSTPHHGGILWLTGLSGSGKTTLANCLHHELTTRGYHSFVLDGDLLREGLNADLGFSADERHENVRRAGEVAALFASAGVVAIAAFIAPYRADRDRIRARHAEFFHEVHVAASLAACERRDPKGLYAKARAGRIPEFTGVSAPYEPPLHAELVLDTERFAAAACLERMLDYAERSFATPRSRQGSLRPA